MPDISDFSTHSLRAGGASRSAAAIAGVADRVFQRHGRWKSVSAKIVSFPAFGYLSMFFYSSCSLHLPFF